MPKNNLLKEKKKYSSIHKKEIKKEEEISFFIKLLK